jgi:hypothetical protein
VNASCFRSNHGEVFSFSRAKYQSTGFKLTGSWPSGL